MEAREGMYMITKITSGCVVERRKSWVGRRPSKRGARVKGSSAEKKQENNRQQAVLALARILNCNCARGDALLTLSFSQEALLRCGGTLEGARREARRFLDRVAYRVKKNGGTLRWVLVPSELDGETGEVVRPHVHVVLIGAELCLEGKAFTLYGQELDGIWGNGSADVQLLRHQKDYYPLARYLIMQARGAADEKKYSVSRNMVKPRVEHTYVFSASQLRVPAGGTMLAGTRYDPENNVNFVRYIPADRREQARRKIGGHKEMARALAADVGEEADGA